MTASAWCSGTVATPAPTTRCAGRARKATSAAGTVRPGPRATSRIGTDAPGHVGSYIVKWIVNDRVVAHWRRFNHVGD
jgi:hypothetical protein